MPRALRNFVPLPALPEGAQTLSDWLQLQVLPPRAAVRLQVRAGSTAGLAGVSIADVPLPGRPNTWAGTDPVICRVAPDAWLLQSRRNSGAALATTIRSALGTLASAVTELSDALLTFELEGPDSYAVLARGCGLDLSPQAFGTRACASTRLAQCPALIRHAAPARIEIVIDRALAEYLHDWLLDAAVGLAAVRT